MQLYNEDFPYQVHFKIIDWRIKCNDTNINVINDYIEGIQDWCNKTFNKNDWDYIYYHSDYSESALDVFKFRTDEYRTMFLLKWG